MVTAYLSYFLGFSSVFTARSDVFMEYDVIDVHSLTVSSLVTY